jgi:hypothetical protein
MFKRLACILSGRHHVEVVLFARSDGRVEQRRLCTACGLA